MVGFVENAISKPMKINPTPLVLSCACALLSLTPPAVQAQVLQHEYSFYNTTNGAPSAVDLVGTNNGTLVGDANISGGQLVLDGTAYVSLQPGIITNDAAVTVEAWGDYAALGVQGGWAN